MSQPALGSKPPFTYLPRLDEHQAPAQDTSGFIRFDWLSHHDLRPHTSRKFGPPRSWRTSHFTADCRAPVAQP
jgi:hypothetical protein